MILIRFLIIVFLCHSLYAGIKIGADYNVQGTVLPKDADVILMGTDNAIWYELFESKKRIGFVKQDCVGIQGESLLLEKECDLYNDVVKDVTPNKKLTSGRKFKDFRLTNSSVSTIMYSGNTYQVPSEILKFVRPNKIEESIYDSVPIEAVIKLRKENILVSPYIDKTMYVSTILGVFTSFDAKKWYRLKKLDSRKYEIAVTQDGWLLADNLVSRDFGRNFEEFFPSFAFPYKDAYVKGILISPQGVNAVYLTFSSRSNSGNMTLYMLLSSERGWRKIYPSSEGSVVIVPAEDAMTSILKFLNNKWLKNNKYSKKGLIDIEDIDVVGEGISRNVGMMVTRTINGNKKNYRVSLLLDYNALKGWTVNNEKWSLI